MSLWTDAPRAWRTAEWTQKRTRVSSVKERWRRTWYPTSRGSAPSLPAESSSFTGGGTCGERGSRREPRFFSSLGGWSAGCVRYPLNPPAVYFHISCLPSPPLPHASPHSLLPGAPWAPLGWVPRTQLGNSLECLVDLCSNQNKGFIECGVGERITRNMFRPHSGLGILKMLPLRTFALMTTPMHFILGVWLGVNL